MPHTPILPNLSLKFSLALLISLSSPSCNSENKEEQHSHETQVKREVIELEDDNDFNLHSFSHGEEPYLGLIRTTQLLSAMQIRGWSLAHIKRGKYMIYIKNGENWTFLDGRDIDSSRAEYLYLKYAQNGEDIVLHSLTNSSSSSVSLPSPFTSAGKFRTSPLLAKDGKQTLCETYDKKGSIILILKGVNNTVDK